MRFVLTDIEGTTTSVAFVFETLFPYFKTHIEAFLQAHSADPEVVAATDLLRASLREEGQPDIADLAAVLIAWTNEDRKHPALKTLQGLLWRTAYEQGTLKGHIYPDVLSALERWRAAGIGLGVYSSGSVAAQRLLFGYSEQGDLTHFFSHYFDTAVGTKRERASYTAIAFQLQIPTSEILFLSDVTAELEAAAAAGMHTLQLLRPGTEAGNGHTCVADFEAIFTHYPL